MVGAFVDGGDVLDGGFVEQSYALAGAFLLKLAQSSHVFLALVCSLRLAQKRGLMHM
jgi:hypothetical protein